MRQVSLCSKWRNRQTLLEEKEATKMSPEGPKASPTGRLRAPPEKELTRVHVAVLKVRTALSFPETTWRRLPSGVKRRPNGWLSYKRREDLKANWE